MLTPSAAIAATLLGAASALDGIPLGAIQLGGAGLIALTVWSLKRNIDAQDEKHTACDARIAQLEKDLGALRERVVALETLVK